ncbi:acyltransferase family protein [Paenibacillus qinlingensis]|nr:acyltransferase family protein [Paenibacillus qinlingensis]
MVSSVSDGRHYMPGLDGLRALSVLVVIVYHLNSSWIPGGLLGVGVFFTLSGYLITDQLLMQWQTTRRIDLKHFWKKRMLRLMPAMIFMLVIVGLWLLIIDRSRLMPLADEFISVLFYFNNWWLIFHHVSYFESFGPPSPIGHLWSLAIEEQFYFLWPLLLAIVLQVAKRRGYLILFTLLGALASMLVMAMVYQPGVDPSRVYYGTDTRAFALLIGGALAIVCPSRRLTKHAASGRSSSMLNGIGGAAFVGILLMMWKSDAYDASLYYGGLALFSVLSAIVIVAIIHPASRLSKVMGCKPLRWIGKRSYSLYIWHYPVIILTSSAIDTGETNWVKMGMQVVLSFLLAAFSFSYIEEPFRRNGFQPCFWKMNFWSPTRFRYLVVITMMPIQLFVISCSNNLSAQKSIDSLSSAMEGVSTVNVTSTTGASTGASTLPVTSPVTETQSTPVLEPPSPSIPTPVPSGTQNAEKTVVPAADPAHEKEKRITVIGDSVILDAAPFLEELFPGIVVDGKVGRQMVQAQSTINELKSKGLLNDRVIIELGSNGAFNPNQLRDLLASLGEMKQIILVNTRVPRSWEGTVNATLKKVATEFPAATVVDWYSASKGKGAYFVNDGVHLTEVGAQTYATLISKAIH